MSGAERHQQRQRREQTTSATHKGHVISFVQRADGRIFYTVSKESQPAQEASGQQQQAAAVPEKELRFPSEVFLSTCVGVVDPTAMPVSVQDAGAPTTAAAGDPYWTSTARLGGPGSSFVVLSDDSEIYLFRQAADKTDLYQTTSGGSSCRSSGLRRDSQGKKIPVVAPNSILVDRFVLVHKDLSVKKCMTKELELGMEPTAELGFISKIESGEFDVQWLDMGANKSWRTEIQNVATGLKEVCDFRRDISGVYVRAEPEGFDPTTGAAISENTQDLLRAETPAGVISVLRRVWKPSDGDPFSKKMGVISGLRQAPFSKQPHKIPRSSLGVLESRQANLSDRFAAADILAWYIANSHVPRRVMREVIEGVLELCGSEVVGIQCGGLRAIRNLMDHSSHCAKVIRASKNFPSLFPLPTNSLCMAFLNDIIRNLTKLGDEDISAKIMRAVLSRGPNLLTFKSLGSPALVLMVILFLVAMLASITVIMVQTAKSMGLTINHMENVNMQLQGMAERRDSTNKSDTAVYMLSILSAVVSHTLHLLGGK